jgi:hypothetical protein
LKRFPMKIIAWTLALIMIAGTVGCTSQHYLNADTTKSTEEIIVIEETIEPIKMLPREQEKFTVSVRSVEEEKNEVKSINSDLIFDPQIEEQLLRKKMEQIKPIQGLFETTLETIRADDKISIHFDIKNTSEKDLLITYGSGQQYDILIYNEQHEEVYKWSHNKAFTMALITRQLDKSGQLVFYEEWNLKDNKDTPVPAGKYTIVVRVMIELESGNMNPEELIAKSIVVIE